MVIFVSGDCGHKHAVLVTEDARLYGFGSNKCHQTGDFSGEKY